jgi:STE24 endopeptidase
MPREVRMTASHVFYAFITLFALEFLIERALSWINLRHTSANRHVIPDPLKAHITPETRQKSVEYTIANTRYGFISAFFNAGVTLVLLFSGVLPWLDAALLRLSLGELTHSVALLVSLSIAGMIVGLPFQIYHTFWLEQRFGFNTMDARTFIVDRLKGLLLLFLLGVPLLYALFAFMKWTGPYWWVWATAFMIGYQLIMIVLYPVLIAPLFNKFTPLEDGELKKSLEDLAQRCGFAARGIFVMDGSKRSKHSNAYFTGFGRFRRIVLFDTLVNQLSHAELAAVLAHEIGHYKRKHILKHFILSAFWTLAGFYVLSLLLEWRPMYEAFGISTPSLAIGFVLFGVLSGTFTFWVGPLMNWISRKHEYEADAYARDHTSADPMKTALVKLHEKNLSNVTPHPLFSAYHYSHPTLLERIAALS